MLAAPAEAGELSLRPYLARIPHLDPAPVCGRVVRVVGLVVESIGPRARVGEVCELRSGSLRLPLEVVGFRDGHVLSVPLGDTAGIRPGDRIVSRGAVLSMPSGDALLGRVIDGLGRAIDALLTCGRGQRIGLFGGSGVGKSTLLGMMARGTEADVVVLALVGERG